MTVRSVPRATVVFTATNAAASAVVGASWAAAAGRVHVADQLLWLTVATVAVIGAALADAVLVVAFRRRVAERAVALRAWALPPGPAPEPAPAVGLDSVTVVGGGRLAHDPACPLVAGKATAGAEVGAPTCPVCRR